MDIEQFFEQQLAQWPEAAARYEALNGVRLKELEVDGIRYRMQCNPARIVSSGAKVDAASIGKRPCFLCGKNRPAQQIVLPWGGHYEILVNPFPIFRQHLTIPEVSHTPQRIGSRLGDMLDLAHDLPEFTLFYNGPHCGASAPDHAHFQAAPRGQMPIEQQWQALAGEPAAHQGEAKLYLLNEQPRTTVVIVSPRREDALTLAQEVISLLPLQEEAPEEPMLNLLALYEEGRWTMILFPRLKHRPACYSEADETRRLLCSPASVDMGGLFILPRPEDFEKMTAHDIRQILQEVCLPPSAIRRELLK